MAPKKRKGAAKQKQGTAKKLKARAQTAQPRLQLKDISKFFATPNFKSANNQLQRRLVRKGQLRHPMQVFEDPSKQALLVKLEELGSINLWGDNNTTGAHSMQLAVSMQQHFANPEQTALPAKGKEYPGLGYKRLRDQPPKAQQQHQLQSPAVAK
ncbi:hypothetical protein QJQ45_000765 [Haematococcus lacustris]|nr:hypothetical protein QJQ45_000765 [Haematococcus lacustris]